MKNPQTGKLPVFHNYEEFCGLLHDRLHALLFHLEDLKNNSFMLHMNLFPLHEPDFAAMGIYFLAGAASQQKIFEEDLNLDYKERAIFQPHWTYLQNTLLLPEIEGLETPIHGNKYAEASLSFNDIAVRNLANDYFRDYLSKRTFQNEFKANEYPILLKYFGNLEKTYFLSIPLISFGKIQGNIHIIFKESEREKFEKKSLLKRVIKLFSLQYEELLIAWENKDENVYGYSELYYLDLLDEEYYRDRNRNPILQELNFDRFYKISHSYIQTRIKDNNKTTDLIFDYARQIATISILVDSFSHNISAHSLTALNWWFRLRAKWLKHHQYLKKALGKNDLEKVKIQNKILENIREEFGSDNNPFLEDKKPMSNEIYPIMRFLMEKGAFWTGVTRGRNFGGKVSNLGNMLWFDFFNNPLYLGTIAYSEGIQRLNISLIFYKKSYTQKGRIFQRKVARNEQGEELAGNYVTIALTKDATKEARQLPELKSQFQQIKEEHSRFVLPGEKFIALHEQLDKIRIFFPGGVVGKHGLFTLLENELRNVKHFEEAEQKEMRKNGLNVVLTFMPLSVQPDGQETELYEIGIWLKHPTKLREGQKAPVIQQRYDGVNQDIITEDLKPRLGGTAQDKLCAAMLFNNNFGSVQNRITERDKLYYPWVFTASASKEDMHTDYVMWYNEQKYIRKVKTKAFASPPNDPNLHSQALNLFHQDIDKTYPHSRGYIKKYFFAWEGAELYEVKNQQSLEWENISRFRFVQVDSEDFELIKQVRKQGIIRIIPKVINVEAAWESWIAKWISQELDSSILFKEGIHNHAAIIRNGDTLSFISGADLTIDELPSFRTIELSHGGESVPKQDACNFRSHGTFATKFGGERGHIRDVKKMEEKLLYELYETLETRICIFDNRVFKRIPKNKEKVAVFRDCLYTEFYEEEEAKWKEMCQMGKLENVNFLVMHLSFIEKLTDQEGNRYGEERIGDFISEQIPKACRDRANFILVITTGRGRRVWWESITDTDHMRFTTFRPIETFITSVENAVQKYDDFEVKHNLLKVLFGS